MKKMECFKTELQYFAHDSQIKRRRTFCICLWYTNPKYFTFLLKPGVNRANFFLRIWTVLLFLAVKLGHFMVIELIYYVTKLKNLTSKIGKRRKMKFGKIDSRTLPMYSTTNIFQIQSIVGHKSQTRYNEQSKKFEYFGA